jgi:hypothetical protein
VRFRVPAGTSTVVYAAWFSAPSTQPPVTADEAGYDAARQRVTRFWQHVLGAGALYSVPEPEVEHAELALLVQQIEATWRYSLGNPYEELSFAEALDNAEVMARYGFPEVAKAILRFSLHRLPQRYTAWHAGERLLAGAVDYDLFRDRAYLREETPGLARAMRRLAASQIKSGPLRGQLPPEQLSSDLPDPVDALPAQVVAWQGLLAMGRVWHDTGHAQLAAVSRRTALRLESALRRAIRDSLIRLSDGSLYLPDTLSHGDPPYRSITDMRGGSYWNLVMPYVFASGFFPPKSAAAQGFIRYLLGHGTRLLGVTRADAHIIYLNGLLLGTGLGQVYNLQVSRFLADNDEPDQLVLSLYGLLAIGMTEDTYVSGESVSVSPLPGRYYRAMFMPPNTGVTGSFLETLRVMLVNEERARGGAPEGLELAFSTPRAWLTDGSEISVDNAPTSFGRVSYAIVRSGSRVVVDIAAGLAKAEAAPRAPPPSRGRAGHRR